MTTSEAYKNLRDAHAASLHAQVPPQQHAFNAALMALINAMGVPGDDDVSEETPNVVVESDDIDEATVEGAGASA